MRKRNSVSGSVSKRDRTGVAMVTFLVPFYHVLFGNDWLKHFFPIPNLFYFYITYIIFGTCGQHVCEIKMIKQTTEK